MQYTILEMIDEKWFEIAVIHYLVIAANLGDVCFLNNSLRNLQCKLKREQRTLSNQAVAAAMKSYERNKAEKAKLNGFLTTLVYNFRWRLPQ